MTTQLLSRRTQDGFTLIETMITTLILAVVCGTVMQGVLGLTRVQGSVMNRTNMHAGVRNATELLTQEIGQAGRIALPAAVTLTAATAAGAAAFNVTSTAGMFVGEQLSVDTGATQETAAVTAINGNQITVAPLVNAHANNAPVSVLGGFQAGVVPPAPGFVNGSTGTVLKIFGDIDGNNTMQYVEYTCDLNQGRLSRNAMAFTAGAKPALTVEQILIDNILANPDGSPCFTYQVQTVNLVPYVVDVAITLTVRSQNRNRNTNQFETETKALLNVSPRNVFNVWQLAGLGISNRVQPMPPTVQALLQ